MKYLISETIYILNSLITPYRGSFDYKKFVNDGILIIPEYFSEEQVEKMISLIDWEKYNWVDDFNSDKRIYNLKLEELKKLDTKIDRLYSKYINRFKKDSFWMGNKISFKEGNPGSGGGWHRDSLNRRQLKCLVYLSDAKIDNGAFQYIKTTHSITNKLKIGMKTGLKKFRYSEDEVDLLQLESCTLTCEAKKGTLVIFDSSGLHRGAPLRKGERIALTKYLFDTGIPDDIRSIYNK